MLLKGNLVINPTFKARISVIYMNFGCVYFYEITIILHEMKVSDFYNNYDSLVQFLNESLVFYEN
jgi:hypothetical protein